jgi:hypothetical protein
MAHIKDALFRYRAINECLRNRTKVWTRTNIHEKVNRRIKTKFGEKEIVSLNTIDADLYAMEVYFDSPIETEPYGRGKRIFYTEPDYCFLTSLKNHERRIVKDAALLVNHLPGFSKFRAFQAIAKKLGIRDVSSLVPEAPVIAYTSVPEVPGLRFKEPLFDAITEKRTISLLYQRFDEAAPSVRRVHPYFLKQYNSLWYLFCFNEERQDYATFALDRIKEISDCDLPCRDSDYKDPNDYYRDVIGVTVPKGEPVQDIELVFSPARGPYISALKLHPSQEIRKLPSGNFQVSLKLKINPELFNILLGYGKDVHVIKPARLKDLLDKGNIDALNSRE